MARPLAARTPVRMLANPVRETPSNDPLLDEIFSVVQLPAVEYHDRAFQKPYSTDDEQAAIQQLDDFLKQNSSTGSIADSEPSEEDLPMDDEIALEESSSSTLKTSRANTTLSHTQAHEVVHPLVYGSYEIKDEPGHANWPEPESEASKFARLGGPKAPQSDAGRSRSMTVDSMASMAESRFGGFDLVDEHGYELAAEIDLGHNEVAYERSDIAPHSQIPIPEPVFLPRAIDHKPLYDRQRQLAAARIKEENLTKEIHKMQSIVLSKEVLVRKVASDTRKMLAEKQSGSAVAAAPSKPTHNGFGHSYQHYAHPVQMPQQLPYRRLQNVTATPPPQVVHATSLPKQSQPVQRKHQTRSFSFEQREEPLRTQLHQKSYSFNRDESLSSPVDIYEEDTPVSPVLNHQLMHAELVEESPNFRYFEPQHERTKLTKDIVKVTVGGQQAPTPDDKAVLLFGPVGSGKSSLVHSIMNYLYDVKKEQDVRFFLDDQEDDQGRPQNEKDSTTKKVIVYEFNNTVYPYRITIVDTPGVPNRKGYSKTSTLIRQWFEQELKKFGSLRIDAISIVLHHDEPQLGWPLINELAAVKRLLKDDLRTNVMPITTFGEVLPQPPALRSMVLANIPFVSYYKVNNAGFMQCPEGQKPLRHNMCYKHTMCELERLFTDLHELVIPLLAVRNY